MFHIFVAFFPPPIGPLSVFLLANFVVVLSVFQKCTLRGFVIILTNTQITKIKFYLALLKVLAKPVPGSQLVGPYGERQAGEDQTPFAPALSPTRLRFRSPRLSFATTN